MNNKNNIRSNSLEDKRIRWDYCNQILNILRSRNGKKTLSSEYNPYKHSKYEKVVVLNGDVIRDKIIDQYDSIKNFMQITTITGDIVWPAIGKKVLTKNALNKLLMVIEMPYKDVKFKVVSRGA